MIGEITHTEEDHDHDSADLREVEANAIWRGGKEGDVTGWGRETRESGGLQ